MLRAKEGHQSGACSGVQGQRATARAVLLRILQIALALSSVLLVTLSLGRSVIPRVFTSDPAVVAAAQAVMPLLAAFMVRPSCFVICLWAGLWLAEVLAVRTALSLPHI